MQDQVVEIEGEYYLLGVFNSINSDKNSLKFLYQQVEFWRKDYRFVFAFSGKEVMGDEIMMFEEFLDQITSIKA